MSVILYKTRCRGRASISDFERGGQFFRYRAVLQLDIIGQPVLERRVILSRNQRGQVLAAFVRDVKAVRRDEIARHLFFLVRDVFEFRGLDCPSVRLVRFADDHGHDGVAALEREVNRGFANSISLLRIGFGRDVARGALQIIGDRPMVFIAELVLDEVGNLRRDAAELRVPERVLEPRFGKEFTVGVAQAFRHADRAITVLLDDGVDAREKLVRIEYEFGEEQDLRRVAGLFGGKSARRGDPARMPAHDFEHEDLGRGARHRRDVVTGFANAGRHVFRDGAEARAAVGHDQIVVDGFGYAHANHRITERAGNLRDLVRGVGRVVAAVIEEIADVVRLEYFDQPFVLGAIFLQALQLVAARAERP